MKQAHAVVIILSTVLAVSDAPARSLAPDQAAQEATAVPGEFVWHDLVTDNPAACRTF